jgi:hypothetical protein
VGADQGDGLKMIIGGAAQLVALRAEQGCLFLRP